MARILNFGSLNIDYVYRVDAFVRPAETKSCKSFLINCGGKGLNQSIAAARAGASVFHAGMVGNNGAFLSDKLEENGVDCSLLWHCDAPSGHAIIEVDDAGQNCILLYGGTNQSLTEAYIDRVLDAFGTDGAVLMQNETNLVGAIIERAHARGLMSVLNAAPMNDAVKRYPLDKLDWLIVNEVEGAGLASCAHEADILPTLHRAYPKLNVLLTLGKRGTVCLSDGAYAYAGSYRVSAVDTTAAGDTYSGCFLNALLNGEKLEDAMRLSAAAAALTVQRPGAADSIPTREETEAALSDHTLGEIGAWGGWK